MCSLGYHVCPSCQEEYHCEQSNSECPVKNGYDTQCQKCDYWQEEIEREEYEKDLERKRWEEEFGPDRDE